MRLELGSLETEVREDRARQDVRREEDLRAQAVQSRESTHNVNAAPVTHGELIAVYDDYPNKVLQLEAIEKQRVKSLQIMDETAAVMGIDNV